MSADDWFDELNNEEYVPLRSPAVNMNVYALDRNGRRIYPGDYVKCEAHGYQNFKRGERRRVISVSMDTLIMRNGASPTGTSAYQPRNFTIAGRHHAWHKTQEAKMAKNTLYAALRINDLSYEQVAANINAADRYSIDPANPSVKASTSFEELKAWLNQRIRANPDERWLILSGTVLAETSAPPVSFRQV